VDPVLTAYSCGYSQGCAVARLVPFLTPNGAGTEANAQGSVGESQAGFQTQNTRVGWVVPSVVLEQGFAGRMRIFGVILSLLSGVAGVVARGETGSRCAAI